MSTLENFSDQVARTSQVVGVSQKTKTGFNWQIHEGDPYLIPVPISSTHSSDITGLYSVAYDHLSLYWESIVPKTTPSFSDLRVYDSDRKTRLTHTVQGAMTHSCTIFFEVTLKAGETKTIYLGHGNNGAENLADDSILGAAMSTDKFTWLRANDPDLVTTKLYNDGERVSNIKNHANEFESVQVIPQDRNATPQLIKNQQAGQQCLRFDGTQKMRVPTAHTIKFSHSTDKLSVFAVLKASSPTNYQSAYRHQDINYVVYPLLLNGRADFVVHADGNVAGSLNTGLVNNQVNIASGHWTRNTINGMRTYRNNTLVAQRNSADVTIANIDNLIIGAFDANASLTFSQFFNGDIYEIISFNDALLDDTERGEVYEYLNAKYKMYGGLENTSYTIGATIEQVPGSTYRRRYYFSNIDKRSWKNKTLKIRLDTAALVTAGKSTADSQDIRVFDAFGNALDFDLYYPNTTDTQIIIKAPSIEAGETYQVDILYSPDEIGSAANREAVIPQFLRDHGFLAIRTLEQNYSNTDKVGIITDYTDQDNDLVQTDTQYQATYRTNQFSGFPALDMDVDWYQTATGTLTGGSATEYSVFAVGQNRTPGFGFLSLANFNKSGQINLFAHQFGSLLMTAPGAPLIQAYAGYDANISELQIISAQVDTSLANSAVGYKGLKIGTTANAQNYDTLTDGTHYFGRREYGVAETTNALIAEVWLCNAAPTDEERLEIVSYFDALYETNSDIYLTYTSDDEEFLDQYTGNNYQDYSHIAKYTLEQTSRKSIGDVVYSTAKVDVMNVIEQPIVDVSTTISTKNSSNTMYKWSRSEVSQEQRTKMPYERKLSFTDASNPDQVRVGYHNPDSKNICNLAQFYSYNDIEKNQSIAFSDDDLFTVKLYVDDVSKIDLSASTIKLDNTNLILPTSAVYQYNDQVFELTSGHPDPFGGNKAIRMRPISNNNAAEILTFASGSFASPAYLAAGMTGVHTGAVYIKHTSNQNTEAVIHGPGYTNGIASIIKSEVDGWERHEVTTTVDNYKYEFFYFGTQSAWQQTDGDIFIFAPTLVPGSTAGEIVGSCSHTVSLDNIQGGLVDGYNEVKIKLGSFTSTGSWAEAQTQSIDIVGNSGESGEAYYSDFFIERNYQEDPRYQPGALMNLGSAVSNDDGASYAHKGKIEAIISSQYISEDTSIVASDPLSVLESVKFSDLPAFDGLDSLIFDWSENPIVGSTNQHWQSYALGRTILRILALIFPAHRIDQAFWISSEDREYLGHINEHYNWRYISIKSEEGVTEKISQLIKGCAGLLVYDSKTNKIRLRYGRERLQLNSTVYNPIKDVRNVLSYREVNSNNVEAYNYIKYDRLLSCLNREHNSTPIQAIGGFGGKAYEIPASSTFDLFIPITEINTGLYEHFVPTIKHLSVGGYNFTVTGGDITTRDNTGVEIRYMSVVGNNILVRVRNWNTQPRYLESMSIFANYHGYIYNRDVVTRTGATGSFNPARNDQFEFTNEQSIKKIGKREYEVLSMYMHIGDYFAYNGSNQIVGALLVVPRWLHWPSIGSWYDLLRTLLYSSGDIQEEIAVTVIDDNEYLCGDLIRIQNSNGTNCIAYITSLYYPDEDVAQINARVIKYE